MKIINLTANSQIYTCNVYLVLGDHNALDDVNTLIDVGRDSEVIGELLEASTGVGKKRIDQIIITHEHYDHTGLLAEIKKEFQPVVYAYKNLEYVDHTLRGYEKLKIGDRECEIIHTPGHSHDSICIYCEAEEVLFCGDIALDIRSRDSFEEYFILALKELYKKDIRVVYPGHGNPISTDVRKIIRESLKVVKGKRLQ